MKRRSQTGLAALPGFQREGMRCPYCGASVQLRSAVGIYKTNADGKWLYVCSNYPVCDAYVRVHAGTTQPVGSLANARLRSLRRAAHQYFDKLYSCGIMSKTQAYAWLADILAAPISQAHIGYLGEYYCQLVIDKSREVLKNHHIRDSGAAGAVQALPMGRKEVAL